MKKLILALGFVVGVLVSAVSFYLLAPQLMINEDTSRFDHATTVQKISESAKGRGWSIPTMHHIDKTVAKAGFNIAPVTVIELCKKELAGKVLAKAENRKVSSMMPCRVSVYEDDNGKVVVSRMNTALVSKLFGTEVAMVMEQATDETEAVLATVIK